MTGIYIGVDPGKNGGFAIIDESKIVYSSDSTVFPWGDKEFAREMRAIENLAGDAKIVAAVERVGAFSGQGVKSMFSFGRSLGFIEGVLSGLKIPYQLIPPVTWKRSFSLIGKDKKASIATCQKLFPELDLMATPRSRVPSDGLAEAALLALYAKRNL